MKPLSLALVALQLTWSAGCGKDAQPPHAADAKTTPSVGTPVTGARGGPAEVEAPVVSAAVTSHERAVREALALSPIVAGERTLHAPNAGLELTLDAAGTEFTGNLAISVLNDGDRGIGELVFAIPANLGADPGAGRPVRIERVAVAGEPVEPTGSASLLRVPVSLAAGSEVDVEIRFAGTVPELRPRTWGLGAEDLDAAAGLAAVDPPGATAMGRRDGLTLFARGYPMLTPPGAALARDATAADVGAFALVHMALDVTAPADVVVAATGVEVARERLPDGRRRTRFVAPAAREVAVVAGRELVEQREKVGAIELVAAARPEGAAAARAVVTAARRALEVYEQAYGPYPRGQLTVVEGPLAAGAAVAFPGLVVVDSLFFAPPTPLDAGEPLLAVLTRHPALREGLEFAVAHAVAHQWWGGLVAVDQLAAPWLGEALAGVSALGYFGDAGARKAERRQRELWLALPYQVAHATGGRDLPVRTAAARLRTTTEIAGIHHGKAALWLDATRRLMSDTLYQETLRKLATERAWGQLDDVAFVDRLAAAAPRPQEIRDLARRWLDEAHGDEDIGPLRPDLLAEYLVSDAAVQGGARELVGLLANNAQVKKLVGDLLTTGEDGAPTLDGARLVGTLAQLLGEDAPPEMKRWLDVLAAAGGGGPASAWGPEVARKLAGELGLGKEEQEVVKGLSALLFRALDAPDDDNAGVPDPDDGAPVPE